jgi:hypothetical protein
VHPGAAVKTAVLRVILPSDKACSYHLWSLNAFVTIGPLLRNMIEITTPRWPGRDGHWFLEARDY